MAETLYGLEKEIREITDHDEEWIASRRATLDQLSNRAVANGLDRQIAVAKKIKGRLDYELDARAPKTGDSEQAEHLNEVEWNSFVSDHLADISDA